MTTNPDKINQTLLWYQSQAKRTCKEMPKMEHRYHMLSGILTELGEFTDLYKKRMAYGKAFTVAEATSEWADTMWYMAGFADYDIDIGRVLYWLHDSKLQVSMLSVLNWLTVDIPRAYTKHVLENSEVEPMIADWINLANFLGFDWEDALQRNIDKLRVRFPEKFEDVLAINRDTDKEDKVL